MRSLAVLSLLVALPAAAAPVRVKNGQSIRVALGDKREHGVALPAVDGSWRLELGDPRGALAAEVIDVTGGFADRWTVAVVGGALLFDGARFRADHAYRVELRCGIKALGSTVVYLTPPPAAPRSTLRFDEGETGDSDEMAPLPKPSL